MALHPTPLLSYDDPAPKYVHVDARLLPPSHAADYIAFGLSVHAPNEEAAREVMAFLGMEPAKIEQRIRVAKGARA